MAGETHAQDNRWRLGANGGFTSNSYHMNTSYQSDWTQRRRGGFSTGLSGQFDINEWLGVRADLMFIQRNYSKCRQMISNSYHYTNNYLQLPVMASLSFGGSKLRGFTNLGVFMGYWTSSNAKVKAMNIFTNNAINTTQSIPLNSTRDNRFTFGYVAGTGVQYQIAPRWSAQGELRCYYDITSQVKQYQPHISDNRYNTTISLQLTGFYHF